MILSLVLASFIFSDFFGLSTFKCRFFYQGTLIASMTRHLPEERPTASEILEFRVFQDKDRVSKRYRLIKYP